MTQRLGWQTTGTHTEAAEAIVRRAFVFTRRARREGCGNVISRLTFAECAQELGLTGDEYSIRTCVRLARAKAREMGETDLLAKDVR